MRLLSWMVSSPKSEWGVREIATAVSLPPSSVHRVLTLMERSGLVVRRSELGTYVLDAEFLRLAHRASTRLPFPPQVSGFLQALVDEVDETACLTLYEPERQMMIYHSVIYSSHPLRYVVDADQWLPVTAGATGLAILAFLPEAEQAALLADPLPAYTESTITNPMALKAELASIRERGFAVSQGQRVAGAAAVAAPVFGVGGQVVGDVVLTIPDQRFDPALTESLARAVLNCTRSITAEIGGLAGAQSTIKDHQRPA
jgi:DNA-binding IclR family transcriptional regulator